MRTAFIETLCALAENDSRIWLLTGDLGFSVLERFATRFPERFVNIGVAEQNMVGVAAGLALAGKKVFTYSIANFPTLRCLEHVRNDICYHDLDVKIVSVGGGLAYGAAGYTHHAVEDLAIMSALPRMVVMAPGDPAEARGAVNASADWAGPCYIRIGKAGEPTLHETRPDFKIGKAILLRQGGDVTLIGTGTILKTVLQAAELLQARGIRARVLSMPTVKPLDEDAVEQAARETHRIACVEEHRAPGGLFNPVAACVVSRTLSCTVLGLNLGDGILQRAFAQDAYLEQAGLSAGAISDSVVRMCN